MLTEQERTNLQQQIDELSDKINVKYDELDKVESTIQANITDWLTKRFVELTSQFEVNAYVNYDFGDYNEETKRYECNATVKVTISCLKDGQSSYDSRFELNISETKTKYSSCSFEYSLEETHMVNKFKMLMSMMNCEEEFRAYCFGMVPEHKQLREDIHELSSTRRPLERQLINDIEERKYRSASELLKEGVIYEDGAARGWYLEVVKISNKVVKCVACKEDYSWSKVPKAVYRMHDRNIKKDDFIRRLMQGFYKQSDVVVTNW